MAPVDVCLAYWDVDEQNNQFLAASWRVNGGLTGSDLDYTAKYVAFSFLPSFCFLFLLLLRHTVSDQWVEWMSSQKLIVMHFSWIRFFSKRKETKSRGKCTNSDQWKCTRDLKTPLDWLLWNFVDIHGPHRMNTDTDTDFYCRLN